MLENVVYYKIFNSYIEIEQRTIVGWNVHKEMLIYIDFF